MKNRLLTCALLSVAAVTACAAFAGCNLFGGSRDETVVNQDNMHFELKDDGTYELVNYDYAYLRDREDRDGGIIEGYKGEGETVTVPETVKGKKVTSLSLGVFSDTGVKTVTLPETITVLPQQAFSGCRLLETVNMPVAVTSVGKHAFNECTNLAEIEFKSGLTEIGYAAFGQCTSLTSIGLPDTVTSVGDFCFRECPFESINLKGVETFGYGAFYDCGNLSSVTLTNVVSIGDRVFQGCDKLTEMTVGNRLEECVYAPPALTKLNISSPVPEKMFQWSKTLTDVTLGEGCTSIGEMAFGYCSELKNLTLPETLTEIGKSAFWESGITAVTLPASVEVMGEKAFYGCSSLVSLTIEYGVESIGEHAFQETGITSLSLPASVRTIGDAAFYHCNSLADITFSEGLETIGKSAFAIKGAETLEIVLPSTVKTIDNDCFYYSEYNESGITANKIIINETVETVGNNILDYCKAKELKAPVNYGYNMGNTLEKLTLFGEGEIRDFAFRNCNYLKTVDLGGGVKKIGSYAFFALETIALDGVGYMGNNALGDLSALTYSKSENGVNYIDDWVISTDYSQGGATNLDLSGVTGIYQNAFAKTDTNDTSVLKTVVLADSDGTSQLKFIGDRAFSKSGITAVEVPASLEFWEGAFRECGALSYIRIQRGIEKIAESAFADCTNLDGLDFSATDVKEICAWAFDGCRNLRLITLPDGIKKIGRYALSSCSSLLIIDLKGTEEIEQSAFCYCTALGEVTMNSVKTIGNSAFYQCTELTGYDLPPTITAIGRHALGSAQTVNYGGTPTQWAAIKKGNEYGRDIWYTNNDLTVIFADGGSATLHKQEK